MIIQKYNLQMTPLKSIVQVNVSQYDNNLRQIIFNLLDGEDEYEIETGASAIVIINNIEYEGTIEDNTVSFVVTSDMTQVKGKYRGEVRIVNNGQIGSANFNFRVSETPN